MNKIQKNSDELKKPDNEVKNYYEDPEKIADLLKSYNETIEEIIVHAKTVMDNDFVEALKKLIITLPEGMTPETEGFPEFVNNISEEKDEERERILKKEPELDTPDADPEVGWVFVEIGDTFDWFVTEEALLKAHGIDPNKESLQTYSKDYSDDYPDEDQQSIMSFIDSRDWTYENDPSESVQVKIVNPIEKVYVDTRKKFGDYDNTQSDEPAMFLSAQEIVLLQAELTAIALERNIALANHDESKLNTINECLYDVTNRISEQFKKLNELEF